MGDLRRSSTEAGGAYAEAYPQCVCAELDGRPPHPWTVKGRRECRRITAVRMRRAGDSTAEIAKNLGVSEGTARELLREGGWHG